METGEMTLIEAWRAGISATARCFGRSRTTPKSSRNCLYITELDMTTLLLTRGPSFPLARLEQRLMCPRCSSRAMLVVFTAPQRERRA